MTPSIQCCLCWLLAISFQVISATTQPQLPSAQQSSFCTEPTVATPPLWLRAANGNSQLWRFGLAQGQLYGWPQVDSRQNGLRNVETKAFARQGPQMTEPQMTGARPVVHNIAMQAVNWLPFNNETQSLESRLLFAWYHPQLQRQQIAIAKGMAAPELLWQSPSYPAHSDPKLNWAAPTLATYRHQGQLLPVVLHHADPASSSRVLLQHALTGEAIISWPLQLTTPTAPLEPWLQLAPLLAAPVTLDKDLDGSLDRIYLLDQAGRLVRVDIVPGTLQAQVHWVADLSASGWQFNGTPQVSRALLMADWPSSAASSALNSQPQRSPESSSRLVGQQTGDVLIVLAQQQERQHLLVLSLPDQPTAQPLHWRQLRDMSSHLMASDDAVAGSSTLPQTTGAVGGWWTALPAAPMHQPSVLAGVIYLPLTSTPRDCSSPLVMSKLLALHLYQGTAVYARPLLATSEITEPWLEPVLLPDERLGLAAMVDGTLVLSGLRGIHQQCPSCSELLSAQQFPIWHRLSSYQHEDGAY